MDTNPSINAEIASVSNGVIVTVRSDAGKIPPYFRTTKIQTTIHLKIVNFSILPATTIDTIIIGINELINQEIKLTVEFKPIIFIV
jgi:hypothetical protein